MAGKRAKPNPDPPAEPAIPTASGKGSPTDQGPPPAPASVSPPVPPTAPNRSAARVLAKVAVGLGLAAAVVAGVAWAGRWAAGELAGRDRYAVRFAHIRCDAPPGTDRPAFLTEVRYLADQPDTVSAVDPALADRLRAAFAKHPWVAAVTGVEVTPDREIRVNLQFRTPAVAVSIAGDPAPRVVDRDAVLLPTTADPAGLPVLAPPVPAPATAAGEAWPDADVKRAVELSQAYPATRIEKTPKGWRITATDGRVLAIGW